MKYLSLLALLISIFANQCFSQHDEYLLDPQVIYHQEPAIINPEQNFLDNPLFINYNLTQHPFPQNEPTVRISRTNPNIVVAAWRDFRLGYLNPVMRRVGYAYSTNGGATWSPPLMLPDPMPGHATQSDPVLINDANGYFYIATTSREQTNVRGETVIYKSTNNGVNWVKYSVAAASGQFEDKEWITCDLVPGSPYFNSLYVTWTRIGSGIRFVKSTNGGLNWTAPVVVGDNNSGQGSNVAVGTNFHIYVVWGIGGSVRFDRSTNGGISFGTDMTISAASSSIGFPFICVDYSNRSTRGNIYVVVDDNRSGTYDIWFQRSTNGGLNWLTSPIRVNDVTTFRQYKPAIQCDTNGYLSVIYYDERFGTGSWNSYWAYSTDQGNTWVNQRLSDSSFAYISIGSEVRNGEYIGIDAYQNNIIPVWCDDRKGTPNQEIYTSKLSIIVSAENKNENVPVEFALKQNHPNPFNPVTKIEFSLPLPSPGVGGINSGGEHIVQLVVYDVLGREVAALIPPLGGGQEGLKPGTYEVQWDATNFPSGVYFYKLQAGSFTDTKKMLLIK
jgi:hypothetical protein